MTDFLFYLLFFFLYCMKNKLWKFDRFYILFILLALQALSDELIKFDDYIN